MLRSFEGVADFLEPTDDRGTRSWTRDIGVDVFEDEERSDVSGGNISGTKVQNVFEEIDRSTGSSSGTIGGEGVIAGVWPGDGLQLPGGIPEENSHSAGSGKIDEEFGGDTVND